MNIYQEIKQAAAIRLMGIDSLASLERAYADIRYRCDQVKAGLITLNEAKKLAQ